MSRKGRVAMTGWAALFCAACFAAFAAQVASGASVGNPPAHASSTIAVRVKGISGKVSAYLSPARKLKHGDYLLGHVRVKHGKVTLKIGSHVKSGSYYVVLCTGSGRHEHCVASKHKTSVTHLLGFTPPPTQHGTEQKHPGEEKHGGEEEKKVRSECEPVVGGSGSEVSKCGGVISTKGPEGTTFTLAYAKGAAVPGTKITLTPVDEDALPKRDLKGGTLLGGVRVEPANVSFYRNTYLVITPPAEPSERKRIAVSFGPEGEHMHPIPIAPQGTPIVLPVGGGGGYALVGDVELPPAEKEAGRIGGVRTDAEGPYAAGYQEHLAELIQELDPSTDPDLNNPNSEFFKTAVEILKEWYKQIETTLFEPARDSDEGAETAIIELTTWARTGALLIGDSSGSVGSLKLFPHEWGGMSEVFGNGWEEEMVFKPAREFIGKSYDRWQESCREEHNLSYIEKIFSRAREYTLLGGAEPSFKDLLSCETFKLTFESTMFDEFTHINGHGSLTNQYVAHFTVKPETENTSTFPLKGEGTGKYAIAEGEVVKEEECAEGPQFNNILEEEGSGTGAPIKLTHLTVPGGFGGANGSPGMMALYIGEPSENDHEFSTGTCNGTEPPDYHIPFKFWYADWLVGHEEDITVEPEGEGYELVFAFELPGGSVENLEYTDEKTFPREAFSVNEHTAIKVEQIDESFHEL